MSRPIDYLESAVSDRPHSQMDRLLLEYEMDKDPLSGLVQETQYSMSVPRTLHPEDALPIGKGAKIIGNIISGKYVPDRVLKKRIADSKLADSFAEKIKELKKFIDDRGFMGYASSSEITKAKKKMKELRDSYDELRPAMKGRNFQQGGPAERPPLLGYMNPAVQDETAHSQMDRLMFENELEQQPQYSMGIQQEVYDPAQAWGEGMMPIGGMAKLVKHGTSKGKKILDFIKSDLKKNTKRLSMEAKEHANQIKNIKKDIKETQSWWTKKGKPSFKTAEEVRNQMELVEKYPVHFMKKGVKGVQYPKKTPEYKLFMDRMRHTARNLEVKNKMQSFADYKFTESSLLKNRNDFLIKAINDYKKTGMVRPSVEKTISQYSKGLERLPKSAGPSLNDILKSLPENPF